MCVLQPLAVLRGGEHTDAHSRASSRLSKALTLRSLSTVRCESEGRPGTSVQRNHRAAAAGKGRGRSGDGLETGRAAMAADGQRAERGSGVLELPSAPRLVCVEYPGLVRDVGAMLRTLGGEEGVSRVRGCRRPRVREAGCGLRGVSGR